MEITIRDTKYSYRYSLEGLFNFEQTSGTVIPRNLKEMSYLMLSQILTSNPDADIDPNDFYEALENNPGYMIEFQEAYKAFNKRQDALLAQYQDDKKKATENLSL